MTTKEQERKALEQIKKILGTLEENSYVATAMRGMIEDAEENIENDFAMSRYDAWQDAEHKADCLAQELKEAKEQLAEMQSKSITTEEAVDIRNVVNKYREICKRNEYDNAQNIITYADNTKSNEFTEAVWRHREAQKDRARCERIDDMLRTRFSR